jgi:hypothetical protein
VCIWGGSRESRVKAKAAKAFAAKIKPTKHSRAGTILLKTDIIGLTLSYSVRGRDRLSYKPLYWAIVSIRRHQSLYIYGY